MGRRTRIGALAMALGLMAVPAPGTAVVPEPEISWAVEPSGTIHDVETDAEGRTYVVGTVRRIVDDQNIGFMRVRAFDPAGQVLWSDAWGVPRAETPEGWPMWTFGDEVALGSDGSVYVAGSLWGGLCGSWFVRRYTVNGQLTWHREEAGARRCANLDSPTGLSVGRRTVVLGGVEIGDGFGAHSGWLETFELDGSPRWSRAFTVPEDWIENVGDVVMAPHGRIVVVGAIAPPEILEGRAGFEAVVQELDGSGRVLWTRRFRDGEPRDHDRATAVALIGRDVAVAGPVERNGRPAAWVSRLTARGGVLWQRLEVAAGLGWTVDVDALPRGGLVAGWRERRSDGVHVLVTALGAGGERVWRSTAWRVTEGGRNVVFEGIGASEVGLSVGATRYRGDIGPEYAITARVVRYAFSPS